MRPRPEAVRTYLEARREDAKDANMVQNRTNVPSSQNSHSTIAHATHSITLQSSQTEKAKETFSVKYQKNTVPSVTEPLQVKPEH